MPAVGDIYRRGDAKYRGRTRLQVLTRTCMPDHDVFHGEAQKVLVASVPASPFCSRRACRGLQAVMSKFGLREGKDEQTYGLGLKEVWRVPKEKCKPG